MNSNQYYTELKTKWLEDFNKHHGTTSVFCRDRHIKGLIRKKPWYMLSKRDSIAILNRKRRTKLNHTELMEGYVQHKLKKWEHKHPCPAKPDDLFYDQYYPGWKADYDIEEERLRNVIIAKYDKLSLIGRFTEPNESYKEQEIATVKNNVSVSVNDLPVDSKPIQTAQQITNQIKAKRPTLVCTNLRERRTKRGRILLPKAA